MLMLAVKPTPSTQLHQFGTIRGLPLGDSGRVYSVSEIEEKPSVDHAMNHLVTPGLPEGRFLCHFGIHVFSSAIFDCLRVMTRIQGPTNGSGYLAIAYSGQVILYRVDDTGSLGWIFWRRRTWM
jgi:UTP-glucose-1-phosphate uridylyltransferase